MVINYGGDNVFSLKVNLSARKIYDFVTNGSGTLCPVFFSSRKTKIIVIEYHNCKVNKFKLRDTS